MTSDWKFEYSEILTKKLKKLKKKNPHQYHIILKKRDTIKETVKIDPDHFKNLRYDLSKFKRVHVDKHFVLVFKVDKSNKIVRFEDYDHHDKIY
tara:strand:+ start:305 stop:586 length:282 start_codon:yes stop_codon:yes gene_type:complete